MNFLADLVRGLHAAFVLWMVWAPFSGSLQMLQLHALVAPFLMLHWATNSHECALSLMESKLRGIPAEQSFIHSVVAPVYVISDASVRRIAWISTLSLWGITLTKLYCHYHGAAR